MNNHEGFNVQLKYDVPKMLPFERLNKESMHQYIDQDPIWKKRYRPAREVPVRWHYFDPGEELAMLSPEEVPLLSKGEGL